MIVLWTANQCLRAPESFDSGLYHFQSIRWLNEYPIVPGLGNLHGRLAFNQSYFVLPAVLNAAPYFNKGHYLANGLLLAVLALQLLYRVMVPGSLSLRLFAAFMSVVALKQIERESPSSPTPDIAIFVMGVLVMLWFVEFLIQTRQSPEDLPASCACIVTMAVLGVTLKLSCSGFAVAITLLSALITFHAGRKTLQPRMTPAVLSGVVLSFLLGSVWLARGVISSGYPAYPSTLAGMRVDWKIPAHKAARMRAVISEWARAPDPKRTTANTNWFEPWLARTARNSQVNRPLALLFVAGAALGVLRLRTGIKFQSDLWLPLLPPLAWLLFWFVTAPDPRFARAPLWLLAGWPAAWFVTRVAEIRAWQNSRIMQMALVLALLWTVPSAVRKGRTVTDLAACNFGALPQPALRDFHTASGLKLLVPETVGGRAWNAPLPSTPTPDPTLELRGRSLADGFRTRPAQRKVLTNIQSNP